jgi:nitrate/TMAO reductase-like tetraheme cytochrome c subunit
MEQLSAMGGAKTALGGLSFLAWVTIACAAASVAILAVFLVKRPQLGLPTKLWLLLGIGVFPLGAAFSGNVAGFTVSTERRFCNSCHVMEPWVQDVEDPHSESLAALHSRNRWFGHESCYTCHADYGMFGTVNTKLNGMKHVYHYFGSYRGMPIEQAKHEIELYQPYPNANCLQCHSTLLPGYADVPEHQSLGDDVRTGNVSCASNGCHGPAHGVKP